MTRKGSQGGILRIAGEEPKVCRERNGIFLPFAYTQFEPFPRTCHDVNARRLLV